jgi:hypothetical protein
MATFSELLIQLVNGNMLRLSLSLERDFAGFNTKTMVVLGYD